MLLLRAVHFRLHTVKDITVIVKAAREPSFQASCTGAAREPFIPSIVYGDTVPAGQARFHGFVSRH